MSEHALELVKSEKLINRSEMLDLWDLARQEQDLEARARGGEGGQRNAGTEGGREESAPAKKKEIRPEKRAGRDGGRG